MRCLAWKACLYFFLISFGWELLGADLDHGFTDELEETHPALADTWLFQARRALFDDDNVGYVDFGIIQAFIDDWDLTAKDAKWVNCFFASMEKEYRGSYKGFKHTYDTKTVNERMESLDNRNVNKPKMRRRFKSLFVIEPSAAKFLTAQELWDAVTIDDNWKLFRQYIQHLKVALEEHSLSEHAFAYRFTYLMNLIIHGYLANTTEIDLLVNLVCNPNASEAMFKLPIGIVKSLLKSGLKIENFILPPKLFKAIRTLKDVSLIATMLNTLRPKIAAIEKMKDLKGGSNNLKIDAICLRAETSFELGKITDAKRSLYSNYVALMHEKPELADTILWGLQAITIVDLLNKEKDQEFIKNWLNILVQCVESRRSNSEKRVPFISGIYLLRAAFAEQRGDQISAQLDRSSALKHGILDPMKQQEAAEAANYLEKYAEELSLSFSRPCGADLSNKELQITEGY